MAEKILKWRKTLDKEILLIAGLILGFVVGHLMTIVALAIPLGG